MSVDIRCGQCGWLLHVDQHPGGQAGCPHCGAVLHVPHHSAVVPQAVVPQAVTEGNPPPPKKRGLPTGPVIGIGAGLLTLVLGLIVCLFAFSGGRQPAQRLQHKPQARRLQTNPQVQPTTRQPAPPPRAFRPGRNGSESGNALNRSRPIPNQFPFAPETGTSAPPWNVQADPPPEDLAWPESTEPVSLQAGKADNFLFPTASCRVIALTSPISRDRFCEVWNLARMERIGRIEKLDQTDTPNALSPDGRFFAARTRDSSTYKYLLGVWSVESGALLHKLTPTTINHETMLVFAGTQRLVTLSTKHPTQTVEVWNVNDGRLLQTFQITTDHRWNHSLAISPGGRYLVKIDDTLKAYDLVEGKLVGEIRLSPGSGKWPCQGATYSPDGTELVAVLGGNGSTRLFHLDMTSGKTILDKTLPTSLEQMVGSRNPAKGLPLDWLLGGEGWLVGSRAFVGREAGEVIWQLPASSEVTERHVLDARRMLEVCGPSHSATRVVSVDLPLEELAAGLEVVASGGQFIDAALPPISEPDWSSVRNVPLTGAAVDWSARPDPSVTPKSLISRPLLLGPDIIRDVRFSSPEAATAVVHHVDQKTYSRTSRKLTGELPDRLTSYDLVTGQAAEALEVPGGSEFMAVSPDGRLAALVLGKENDRLDVWSLADRSHRVAWRPYGNEDIQVRLSGNSVKTARSVAWAGFVDSEHLLTLSYGGKLALWQLDGVKAEYVMDFAAVTSALLTPGCHYGAVFQGTLLRFFDPLSGRLCGDLPLPYKCSGAMDARQIAFSPTGRDLAIVAPGSVLSTVLLWDLGTGQLTAEIPVAKRTTGLNWCDAEHLLYGGGNMGRGYSSGGDVYLIDVARKAITWRYPLLRGSCLTRGPDSRQWLLSAGTVADPTYLGAMPFSDAPTLARIAQAFPRDKPPLIGPGTKISVQVGSPDLRKILEDKIRENGCEVASDAPIKLILSSAEKGSHNRQYERIGAPKETFTVTTTTYESRLALVDSSGKTLWERTMQYGSGSPGFFVSVPAGRDPQEYLNSRTGHGQGAVRSLVESVRIPRLLYFQPTHDKDVPGLGTTELDIFARFNLRLTRGSRAEPDVPPPSEPSVAAGSAAGAAAAATALDTGARFVRKNCLDLLAGDDAELQDRMRWFPAAKRPSTGLRWGWGVVLTSPGSLPNLDTTEKLGNLTGPIGPAIVGQIETRMEMTVFGLWPRTSPVGSLKMASVGTGKLPQLLERAVQSGLDLLVVMQVNVPNRIEMTMRLKLVDVATGEALWSSKSLSNRKVATARQKGQDPLSELLDSLLTEIDDHYRLEAMPQMTAENVSGRVSSLLAGLEGLDPAARLPILVELRYYQAQGLLTPEAAADAYEQILGKPEARELATQDGPGRKSLVETWLGK